MKLYFDQQLSRTLTRRLADVFPGSAHVLEHHQGGLADRAIWRLAGRDGYIVVSKDSDFLDLSAMYGPPPKLIYLSIGNCSTLAVETLLRESFEAIQSFAADTDPAALVIP